MSDSSWDIPAIVIGSCAIFFVIFAIFIAYQRFKNMITIATNITNPSSMNLTANWSSNNPSEIPTIGVSTNWASKSNHPLGISSKWLPTQSITEAAIGMFDQSTAKNNRLTNQSTMRMNIF
jgi:hypothetical protein